ncbi:histidinol-phosphate/aromatic aminotransferase and cobyric acid decarboxylase [Candidatus Scalindua japonica]|uniref:threonine-phosphate decarboxylase n=1 Tax=Candidatus Scalindua japonica TaxID=1284222 RepID=A0A286TUM7_9BACT|nr:threonine-phosphate decarboxylase CobD [Candidatus Scalindua japonica]GAX59573.1 histidinol-phosphate/aromatic aminotransferase and cobyric acid decarboxylase [Candidatus Scalindua japonica]
MLNGHGGNIKQICNTYGLNPDEIIDFSASINPLGYPEVVRKEVFEQFNDILNYPESRCTDLRESIARKISCNKSNVIIGNGSNELFYLIPRALKPERGVLLHPTFGEFKDSFSNSNINVVEIINDDKDFPLINNNISRLKSVDDCMVFLCNPNNPTGQLTRKEDIIELVNDNPNRLIVIDEAFMDFVEDDGKYSVIKNAPLMDNLIVVRSLTKFYGFPGLRLGYLVANESIVNKLLQYKEPWTVNTMAQVAGIAAINDEEFAANTRKYISSEKTFLYNGLKGLNSIQPFQPTVNFILVRIEDCRTTSSEIQNCLMKNNILIRNCSNFVGLDERFFRVAVKTREQNMKLLSALELIIGDTATKENNRKDSAPEFVTG